MSDYSSRNFTPRREFSASAMGSPKVRGSTMTPGDRMDRTQTGANTGARTASKDPLTSTGDVNNLRDIQTVRAAVAAERHKMLSRAQESGGVMGKRASEEQLYEEVGLLMQERDLLLREKSSLQGLLTSASEEIRRLFDAEQEHLEEMKAWIAQRETLSRERDIAALQAREAQADREKLLSLGDKFEREKETWEQERVFIVRERDDVLERLAASVQELDARRHAEVAQKLEKDDLVRQIDSLTTKLAETQAQYEAYASDCHELRAAATVHASQREQWDKDRAQVAAERVQLEHLKASDARHKEEERQWGVLHEQLIAERADAHAQLQLGLQQVEQHQKGMEILGAEKESLVGQLEAANKTRQALEKRVRGLEEDIVVGRRTASDLTRDLADTRETLEATEGQLAASVKEASELATSLGETTRGRDNLKDENSELQRQAEIISQERILLESRLNEAHLDISRLRDAAGQHALEREELLLQQNRYVNELMAVQEDLKATMNDVADMRNVNDGLQRDKLDAEAERVEYMEERARLQNRLKLTLQELDQLRQGESRKEQEAHEWLQHHSYLLQKVAKGNRSTYDFTTR